MHLQVYSKKVYSKIEHCEWQMRNYNNPLNHTNKTIKKPYECSRNHKVCKMCKRNQKGEQKERSKWLNCMQDF